MATGDELPHVWPPEGPAPDASLHVGVHWGAATQQGSTGAQNDDYFAIVRLERRMETLATNLPDGSLPVRHGEAAYGMLVADGIGGLASGEIASRTAVTTLIGLVIGTPDWILRLNDDFRRRMEHRLERRLQWVDRLLSQQGREIAGLRSLGTAMTVAASSGRDLILGHVGNSRAYHWREGVFSRLTRDHTWVQSLVDSRAIEDDEVAFHPNRHILTRALGMGNGQVTVDIHHLGLVDGDRIVLCTDGLSGVVTDSSIADVLQSVQGAAEAAEALVSLARASGPPDDATAVVFDYEIPE
jgi:PPM family protein phosphatase